MVLDCGLWIVDFRWKTWNRELRELTRIRDREFGEQRSYIRKNRTTDERRFTQREEEIAGKLKE
jgi:hypothetical protein